MADNRVLKIPRSVLAAAFNNDQQAIKAMEGLQQQTFVVAPNNLDRIIISIEQAVAEVLQASIMANQVRQEAPVYLQAVGVPYTPQDYLQAVSAADSESGDLSLVGMPCDNSPILNPV